MWEQKESLQAQSLRRDGKTYKEISIILGRTYYSVRCHLYNHKGRYKKNEGKICNNCKKIHKTENLFCSKFCNEDFRFKETLKRIKKGEIPDSSRRVIKAAIIKLRGHKCEICKTEEWQGQKVPLILDHIDGEHENSKLVNLRLVCPNCDAQLPTYKSKNRGKGRKNRTLQYYKDQLKKQNGKD